MPRASTCAGISKVTLRTMANNDKLRFRVVYASSEDPDYPSTQLNEVNPTTKGWLSVRFCSYPQELGFQFIGGECKLSQIQLLSHQNKISSKIEIFVGSGASYETAQFRRLGYMSLDKNEKSSFLARELKTVYIDHSGNYLKLLVNENHPNKHNSYNQVGIVALSVLGCAAQNVSEKVSMPVGLTNAVNPYNDLTVDINLDPHTAKKLRQLAEAKSQAIQNENYLAAKDIKRVEQELKTLGSRLAQLDMAKVEAVAAEDYDLAKDIKDESDQLRLTIEDKIRQIDIPGFTVDSFNKPQLSAYKNKGYNTSYDESDANTALSTKRVVKVEMQNIDDVRDYLPAVFDSNVDRDDEDRPIRPKATTDYNDRDPTIEDSDHSAPTELFPLGQHPLEGIKDYLNLAAPESLSTLSREYCEQSGITRVIGEYRARCLYSKHWNVREAAILKIINLFQEHAFDDISVVLQPLCAVLKLGVEDKIQQVLSATLKLLELVLADCKSARLQRSVVLPLMEPVLLQLVEKLADGNARLRDGARKGLELIAFSPIVGPAAVCSFVTKPLSSKQKTNWRPMASRLEVLTFLVTTFGINSTSGLTVVGLLVFSKTIQAYSHSSGEVREAAKQLVVAIQRIVGSQPLQPTLDLLRKKQREEYEAAFNSESADDSSAPAKDQIIDSSGSAVKQSAKVNTSAVKASQMSSPNNIDQSDFTTCMFCGARDRNWSENDLDLHYWKDCPLLISCPSCAQIVEIAGLPEHLLDECEHKSSYIPCEVTGLAIRKDEYDRWKQSPDCRQAPDNFMYCPLCKAIVEDSDDAWLEHLSIQCPNNKRIHK